MGHKPGFRKSNMADGRHLESHQVLAGCNSVVEWIEIAIEISHNLILGW